MVSTGTTISRTANRDVAVENPAVGRVTSADTSDLRSSLQAEVAGAKTPSPSPSPQELLQRLAERQKDFNDTTVSTAHNLVDGARNQIAADRRSLDRMGVIDRIAGTADVVRDQIKQGEKTVANRTEHEKSVTQTLNDSKELAKQAQLALENAAKLRAAGNVQGAEELTRSATKLATLASERLDGKSAIDVAREKENLKQNLKSVERLTQVTSNIDTSITVAKNTQTVLNTAAVVTATAVGGTGLGSAVNLGLKTAQNSIEGSLDVALGNKTSEQAQKEWLKKQGAVVVESAVLLGAGVAGKAASGMLGASSGIVTKIGVNGAVNAATNMGGQGAMMAWELKSARADFVQQNPELKGAALEAAWNQHKQDMGLNAAAIAKQLAIGGATGLLAGGASSVIPTNASSLVAKAAGRAGNFATNAAAGVAQEVLGTGHATGMGTLDSMLWAATGLKGSHSDLHVRKGNQVHLTPAGEYLHLGAQEIGHKVILEAGTKLGPHAIAQTAHTAADNGLKELGKICIERGEQALTKETMKAAMERSSEKAVTQLMKDAKVTDLVEKHTLKFLETVDTSSTKKLAQDLKEFGIQDTQRAQKMAEDLQKTLRSGRSEVELKQILENGISKEIQQHVEKLMETPFKNRLERGLKGQLSQQGEEFAAVADAMEKKAQRLGKSKEELIGEYVEAGWEGARRGTEKAIRSAVREGVERAVKEFRNRRNRQGRDDAGQYSEIEQPHFEQTQSRDEFAQNYAAPEIAATVANEKQSQQTEHAARRWTVVENTREGRVINTYESHIDGSVQLLDTERVMRDLITSN